MVNNTGMSCTSSGISLKWPCWAEARYPSIAGKSRAYSTVPNCTNVSMMPIDRPRSPMRFMMKAFLPAATALGF